MSLSTGCRLIWNHWTELPLPQDVIDRVNTLGWQSNATTDLTFAWCDGTPINDPDSPDDDPYDSNYLPSEADDDDLSYISDSDFTTKGVDDNNENENHNNYHANDANNNNDNVNSSNNDDDGDDNMNDNINNNNDNNINKHNENEN